MSAQSVVEKATADSGTRALLGRAARLIRGEWERETWNRRDRLYHVAVSDLLIAVALEDDERIKAMAVLAASAYLGESV